MRTDKNADTDSTVSRERSASRLGSLATQRTTRRQRRVWSGRVASWDQHGSAGLTNVTAAVLAAAGVGPGDMVIDLGCGNGQISIPLAREGAEVLGIDVSPAMANQVRAEAKRQGLSTLDVIALPVEELDLPPASADLIVSSYALHHLRDRDKARLVEAAITWLRPGGRLLIADMMFGRGGTSRDREIIKNKLITLARKGPGGWWRIAKNVARYLIRVDEIPISMQAWEGLFRQAGFTAITTAGIVAEAGLVCGQRPASQLESREQAGSRARNAAAAR
ncbi:MAG: class I SAM-dependent methyltransferase [Streptosporangiaceae bacterium]